MPIAVSITESNILAVLRSFLLNILPSGTPVVLGQGNRVPEPASTNFVVMTPIFRERLETNVDSYADVFFTGSISGATLTVTGVFYGTLALGATIFGASVAASTSITALGSGAGGVGTYTVAPSQTAVSQSMAAGAFDALQPTKITVQLDIHGPLAGDNAQIISTLLRDEYAIEQFSTSAFDVTPLFTSDPRQTPFVNAEQQFEYRYTLDVELQANITVAVPQQFADIITVELVEIDTVYPPV